MSPAAVEAPLSEYYIDGVALTTISVFGIIGTLLSLRVLLKLRNSFSSLLSGLAVSDTLFLFFAILIIGLPQTSEWYTIHLSVYVTPIAFGLMGIARTGSVYCTICVTLERYYATAKPFASNGWIKKILMPLAFVFAIVYNIPKFLELKTHTSAFTNKTMIIASDLRHNPIYISVYLTWMKIIIMEAIPYITILTLNICILLKVYSGSKFRNSFKNTANKNTMAKQHRQGFKKFASLQLKLHEKKETSWQRSRRSNKAAGNEDLVENNITSPKRLSQKDKKRSVLPDVIVTTSRGSADDESYEKIEVKEVLLVPEARPSNKCIHRSSSDSKIRSTSSNEDEGRSLSNRLDQERNLAITLIIISILFIVCQSFKIIPDLFEFMCQRVKGGESEECTSALINYFVSVGNLMPCINSAVNFLIYMLRGKKFRDAFRSTYNCDLKHLSCRRRRSLTIHV